MDTILDYILWRSDVSFDQQDITAVDSVVFSFLSYMDLKGVFSDGRKMTIRELCRIQIEKEENEHHKALYNALAESRRFGNVAVSSYMDSLIEESSVQFSCMLFDVKKNLRYIAFRGTDNTLVGWKEDFMTSFTLTGGQKMALRYLQRHLKPGMVYDIGGHSKGGNLAMYALSQIDDAKLKLVRRVYLHDAPGLCPDVMDISGLARIRERTCRIIPSFSVIGKLFEPDIPVSFVVQSSADGIMQHDIETWGVDHGRLLEAAQEDPAAAIINDTVASWLGGVNTQERRAFMDDIFKMVEAGGARTVEELTGEQIGSVLTGLKNTSQETRDAAAKIPMSVLFGEYTDMIWNMPLVKWARTSSVAADLMLICLGYLFQFIPVRLMSTVVAVGIETIVFFEVAVTLRHLFANKWDVKSERVRINISIILVSVGYFIFTKEQTLYNLASVLFGVFFMIQAVNHASALKRHPKFTVAWIRHIVMGILYVLVGIFVMLSAEHSVTWYADMAGALLIADGMIGIVHEIQKKTKK